MSSKNDTDERDKGSSSTETTSTSAAAASPSTAQAPEESSSSSLPPSTTTVSTSTTAVAPSPPPPSSSSNVNNNKKNPSRKVKVHFVPVGSAPILKKAKFQISADQRFGAVHAFLRKLLKRTTPENGNTTAPPLFLYLTSAFCPSLEENVGELEECFAKTGELIVHYSLQEAWG